MGEVRAVHERLEVVGELERHGGNLLLLYGRVVAAARSRTRLLRGRAVNRRGLGAGVPDSTGRPSARHRGRPPSSTATASWPKARNVHQTRAALATPRES